MAGELFRTYGPQAINDLTSSDRACATAIVPCCDCNDTPFVHFDCDFDAPSPCLSQSSSVQCQYVYVSGDPNISDYEGHFESTGWGVTEGCMCSCADPYLVFWSEKGEVVEPPFGMCISYAHPCCPDFATLGVNACDAFSVQSGICVTTTTTTEAPTTTTTQGPTTTTTPTPNEHFVVYCRSFCSDDIIDSCFPGPNRPNNLLPRNWREFGDTGDFAPCEDFDNLEDARKLYFDLRSAGYGATYGRGTCEEKAKYWYLSICPECPRTACTTTTTTAAPTTTTTPSPTTPSPPTTTTLPPATTTTTAGPTTTTLVPPTTTTPLPTTTTLPPPPLGCCYAGCVNCSPDIQAGVLEEDCDGFWSAGCFVNTLMVSCCYFDNECCATTSPPIPPNPNPVDPCINC